MLLGSFKPRTDYLPSSFKFLSVFLTNSGELLKFVIPSFVAFG